MTSLAIGLVYDLLGSHPRRAEDPPDVDAEYEPEATVEALEAAVQHAGHRTQIEKGLEVFRALRGRTSGFAIPQYVLDTPYGKVPLDHPYLRGREGDEVVVETYDGRIWREPNPR